MRRLITFKAIHRGEMIPRFYGVAYHDYPRRVAICYPIPLNWLIRWGRDLYFFLSNAARDDQISQAYKAGFNDGVERGKIHEELDKKTNR